MTVLAVAEHVGNALRALSERVETEHQHGRTIHRVYVGQQVFIVTCEEGERDAQEPPV